MLSFWKNSKRADADGPIDARPSFERYRSRWAFAAGAVAALAVGVVVRGFAEPSGAIASFGASPLQHQPVTPIDGDTILRDIAAAHASAQSSPHGWWQPPHGARPGAAADAERAEPKPAVQPNPPAMKARLRSVANAAPRPAVQKAPAPPAPPADAAETAYSALFGAPEQYRAGNALGSEPSVASSAVDDQNTGEGTLLPARLVTEVASVPTGGPVVATLQRPVRVGNHLLPRGAEIHGTCKGSGNSDTRVFIHFDFVRLSGGRSMSIKGEAVDLQGRNGVPGAKMVTSRSVGSVGLAAATRVARTLGRTVAGSVGSVVGSGLEGAADAGQQKAERFDQDEYVVVAARGTPIQIYVSGFAPAAKKIR